MAKAAVKKYVYVTVRIDQTTGASISMLAHDVRKSTTQPGHTEVRPLEPLKLDGGFQCEVFSVPHKDILFRGVGYRDLGTEEQEGGDGETPTE